MRAPEIVAEMLLTTQAMVDIFKYLTLGANVNATHHNPLSPAAPASDTGSVTTQAGLFALEVGMDSNQDNRRVEANDLRVGQVWRGFAGDTWTVDWFCAATKRAAWTVRFNPVADLDDEFHAGRVVDLLLQLNANRAVLDGATKPVEVEAFTPGPWHVAAGSHVCGAWSAMLRVEADEDFHSSGEDYPDGGSTKSYTNVVCGISGHSETARANARLIAAAPDLYAACKELLRLAADPQCHGYIIRGADGSVSKVRVGNDIIADARALLAQIGGAQ